MPKDEDDDKAEEHLLLIIRLPPNRIGTEPAVWLFLLLLLIALLVGLLNTVAPVLIILVIIMICNCSICYTERIDCLYRAIRFYHYTVERSRYYIPYCNKEF
jgi:hypothetical protein